MMRKSYLPIVFALLLIIGVIVGRYLPGVNTGANFGGSKLNEILGLINSRYVDSVNNAELEDLAIRAMVEDLDPHTEYIKADDLKSANEDLQGNFEGIGVQFQIEKDTLVVIVPLRGGPSEKVGIMAGDRIIKVDDELIAGVKMTTPDIMKRLKGEKGTKVKLEIARRRLDKTLIFEIERDKIPTYSIEVAYMIDETTGLIALSKFAATTYDEMREAIQKLKLRGMDKLILDLRDNTGGYLEAAVGICDEFLNSGHLIVYTEGLHSPKYDYVSNDGGLFTDGQLAILINENSASASEILAGAIQDNDRGVVIGRRSFGKGLVQQQIPLSDGSALRLTVAKYFTPSGRCIQRPFEKNKREDYYVDFYERVGKEMLNKDSIHFDDSLKYQTLRGRTVYGGGGIMPDYFIAADTSAKYIFFNKCINAGLITSFALDYADANRDMLKMYRTANEFVDGFTVNDKVLGDFMAYAAKNGIDIDPKYAEYSRNRVKMYLKALIGRNVVGMDAFYRVYYSDDDMIKRAVEVIHKL